MIRFLLMATAMLSLATAQAQTRMRDIFAETPDSIFPMLSTNNKLDCIDLIENNMQAKVKNCFDEPVELKQLTDSYLRLEMSKKSTVEMKLMNDSIICLIRTYKGPAPDSKVRFYSPQWQLLPIPFPIPKVEAFWMPVPDSVAREAGFVRQSLQALTFVEVRAHADNETLTLTLQTNELCKEEKALAEKYLKPLEWNMPRQ